MLLPHLLLQFVVVLIGLGTSVSSHDSGLSPLGTVCEACVGICNVNCNTKCPPPLTNCDLTPFPAPFCRRWVPCTNNCTCLRSDRPQNASDPADTPTGLPKCAEFEPCTKGCVCTLRSVTSYLNPDKLDPMSLVCDIGLCNTTCFCRTDLLKSLTAVLFPNTTTSIEMLEAADEAQQVIKLDL